MLMRVVPCSVFVFVSFLIPFLGRSPISNAHNQLAELDFVHLSHSTAHMHTAWPHIFRNMQHTVTATVVAVTAVTTTAMTATLQSGNKIIVECNEMRLPYSPMDRNTNDNDQPHATY